MLPVPVFNTWDSKYLALIAKMVRISGMNPKFGGWIPHQADIFLCLKNVYPFTTASVRELKMNAVARAQLTFQMIPLLQICVLERNINEARSIMKETIPNHSWKDTSPILNGVWMNKIPEFSPFVWYRYEEYSSICSLVYHSISRDYSGYGFSQWEATLQRNVVSHWWGLYPEWCM